MEGGRKGEVPIVAAYHIVPYDVHSGCQYLSVGRPDLLYVISQRRGGR